MADTPDVSPAARTRTGFVRRKIWGPDDDYLTVEVQVFEEDGLRAGDEVEVTVRKVSR